MSRQPAASQADRPVPFEHNRLTVAGSIAVAMEHRAEYESGNHIDAEPDCKRASDGDRTGDYAVADGVAGVSGTALVSRNARALTPDAHRCLRSLHGVNSICFDQADMAIYPRVCWRSRA